MSSNNYLLNKFNLKIESTIELLINRLESLWNCEEENENEIIELSKLISRYNKELNEILKEYANSNEENKTKILPYTLFYQNTLTSLFILTRVDLKVDKNKQLLFELTQKLRRREILIQTEYIPYAENHRQSFQTISMELEKILQKKLGISDSLDEDEKD